MGNSGLLFLPSDCVPVEAGEGPRAGAGCFCASPSSGAGAAASDGHDAQIAASLVTRAQCWSQARKTSLGEQVGDAGGVHPLPALALNLVPVSFSSLGRQRSGRVQQEREGIFPLQEGIELGCLTT